MLRKMLEAILGHFLKQAPEQVATEINELGTHLPYNYRVWAQRKLRDLGLNGATRDYKEFPPAMVRAVRDYQSIRGLYVDGLLGPQTWGELIEEGNGPLVIKPATKPVAGGIPWYNEAHKLIGVSEISGGKHNPLIIRMFAVSGHDWVSDDETAWCAAFANYCLETSGWKGTGKLNARSFLDWGKEADKVEQGVIAVFTRGDPNGWQGHVAFCTGKVKSGQIEVLGGNQSNSVNKRWYPREKLLGLRWPT
jgi:uncharacterized protein (TIGR02594 family)